MEYTCGGPEVLLVQWTEMPAYSFDCVELFAGVGNVSKMFRQNGKSVASFDKSYADKAMDMTGAAGFMSDPQCNAYASIQVSIISVHPHLPY